MSSRAFEVRVPKKWVAPAFFESASPEDVAVALDTSSRIVPWVLKVVHAQQDRQDEARLQGVEETVQSALKLLRDDAVAQALQQKHESDLASYDLRAQLEEARAALEEQRHACALAEQRAADAEARGRAQATL
ncbi:MAG: hypothetical protein CMP83_09390, partial [Gammaproteobacteria bacterium]|nr:hypothetical protein [Gammaproteobacteria bacterium]